MSYSVFLFIYVFVSVYIGEYVLIPFVILFSYLGHLKIKLKNTFIFYLIVVFITFLTNFYFNLLDFDLNLAIHLIIILILTLFIRDDNFRIEHLIRVIKAFLIFNIILISVDSIFNNFHFAFYELMGVHRYRSIFSEPAVAGNIFALFSIILYSYHKHFSFWLIITLLLALITLSGSAYLALFIVFLFTLPSIRLKKRSIIVAVIILLCSIPLIYVITQSNAFTKLVVERVDRITDGGDTSSKLRFLAPIQVVEYTLKNSPIFGFGLGSAEKIIDQHRTSFTYFYFFDGTPTNKINNGYAIIFASGGLLLLSTHFILLISIYIYQVNRKSKLLFVFLLLYPMFSGHFVHILYWFIIYLIFQLHYFDKKDSIEMAVI